MNTNAIERLRKALVPGSDARRGSGEYVRVGAVDLIALFEDWHRIDATLRAGHFRTNRLAYPPRAEMMTRVASDPGAYAGPQGERSTGRWIADAILRLDRLSLPEELDILVRRMDDLSGRMSPPASAIVREAQAEIMDQSGRLERLRRILARYGDRLPMAMCHRADWQQEIDEALEWAANNPEPESTS